MDFFKKDARFFDNIMALWCCNFFWFLASCIILFKNMQANNLNGEPFIFLLTMVLIVLLNGLNTFNHSKFRNYVSSFFDCLLILLLPLIFYSFGLSIENSLLIGYINIVIVIALSPKIQLIFNCMAALALAFMISFGNYFENPEIYNEAKANIQHNDANLKIKDMPFEQYKLQKPMTVQEISGLEKTYGNSAYWFTIYKANNDIIKSPSQIVAKDTILKIPKHRGISYKMKIITTAKESSLREIAAREDTYNNAKFWKLIFNANSSIIDNEQQIVKRGTALIIPILPPSNRNFFFKLALIFISAIILALIWKFTIGKIYKMLNIAYSVESKDAFKKIDKYQEQITELTKEVQLMKHELAISIIKMRYTLENNDL